MHGSQTSYMYYLKMHFKSYIIAIQVPSAQLQLPFTMVCMVSSHKLSYYVKFHKGDGWSHLASLRLAMASPTDAQCCNFL